MNKSKKITVITLQNISNYGSVLQAFATQKIFESLNCKVDFINFVRIDQKTFINKINKWCKGFGLIKKLVYAFLLYPTFIKQDKIFKSFLKSYLNVQKKQYSTDDDFKYFPITSDIYCTGSDQTWNSEWNQGIIKAMFLHFVPDNVRKIAYSASFGKQQLDEWEKEETRRLLKRYSAISVRESNGVKICDDLGIHGAVHVLDPTLQMNRDFWQKYAGERKIKVPYVLIYQLNSNPAFDRYAKEFARRKGMKLVRFCWRYDQWIKCGKSLLIPPVEYFVNAICYADTVITDSFHATAFSINMNTDFISIYPHEYSARLNSILQLTHLEYRHLTSYDNFSLVNAPRIDFTEANRILDKEREKGWEFLKKTLE